MAGSDRELLDPPVRRRGVDPLAAGVGDRRRRRDLVRTGPLGIAGRLPLPEDASVVGVDRKRDPVGRGEEERVVGCAVDRDAVQVDRRGVGRAGQVDLLAGERADVRRGDPGRVRIVVRAARVPAEAGPVGARSGDGLARGVDAAGRTAAATAGGENEPRDEDQR
jgi:hypothetical protein